MRTLAWGYDRIVGALANLGHRVSDQTVGNVLRRYGIPPAPKRSQKTTWKEFISAQMAVLETRRVTLAGITRHPTADWMLQLARNAVDEETGHLRSQRYLLHDRDTKFCSAFRDVLKSAGVQPVVLPPQSPNLNAFAERWVRSVKQEACPS